MKARALALNLRTLNNLLYEIKKIQPAPETGMNDHDINSLKRKLSIWAANTRLQYQFMQGKIDKDTSFLCTDCGAELFRKHSYCWHCGKQYHNLPNKEH